MLTSVVFVVVVVVGGGGVGGGGGGGGGGGCGFVGLFMRSFYVLFVLLIPFCFALVLGFSRVFCYVFICLCIFWIRS